MSGPRDACETLRPVLFRVAEAEAGPEEAMAVARHLPDCTPCRILLARERRLATMLEQDLRDDLPVGEDFVDAVMSRLPPAPHRRRRWRRGLKLAGLAAALVVPPAAALGPLATTPRITLALPALGRPELGGGEAWVSGLAGLMRLAQIASGAVAGGLPEWAGSPAHVVLLASALLPAVALAVVLTGGGLAAVCAGSLATSRRRAG